MSGELFSKLHGAIRDSVIAKYAGYLTSLVSLMVLARYFSPEDYGVVAGVTSVMIFFTMLIEALNPAVISVKNLNKVEINTYFTLSIISGALFAVILFNSGDLISQFYFKPEILEIAGYVSCAIFAHALCVVPLALLQKKRRFFAITTFTMIGEIVGATVAILLLWNFAPHIALASKFLVSPAVQVICLIVLSPRMFGHPIGLGLDLTAVKKIAKFIKFQLVFNLMNYIMRVSDNIFVGRFFGLDQLGLYEKSYQLMRYPMYLLTYAIGPAIQPVIVEHSGSKDDIWDVHVRVTALLYLVSSCVAVLFLISVELVVTIVLGPKWIEVAELLKILVFSVPIQIILSASNGFALGLNRPEIQMYNGFVTMIAVVCALIISWYMGNVIYLCISLVVAFHFSFFPSYYIFSKAVFRRSPFKIFFIILPLMLVCNVCLFYVYKSNFQLTL